MKIPKRIIRVGGRGIVMILLCCGVFWLLFGHTHHFFYRPPCHPIEFPSLEQVPYPEWGKIYEYQTDQLADEVVRLLDHKLNAQSSSVGGPGVWWRTELDDGTQVYQCISGADFVDLDSEQGCIYVKETSTGSLIQTGLWDFVTAIPYCGDPAIIP